PTGCAARPPEAKRLENSGNVEQHRRALVPPEESDGERVPLLWAGVAYGHHLVEGGQPEDALGRHGRQQGRGLEHEEPGTRLGFPGRQPQERPDLQDRHDASPYVGHADHVGRPPGYAGDLLECDDLARVPDVDGKGLPPEPEETGPEEALLTSNGRGHGFPPISPLARRPLTVKETLT